LQLGEPPLGQDHQAVVVEEHLGRSAIGVEMRRALRAPVCAKGPLGLADKTSIWASSRAISAMMHSRSSMVTPPDASMQAVKAFEAARAGAAIENAKTTTARSAAGPSGAERPAGATPSWCDARAKRRPTDRR
jgi:hypothetical protein